MKGNRVIATALIAAAMSVTAGIANAESTSAAINAMGLVGTWSSDCAKTKGVSRTTWSVPVLFGSPTVNSSLTNQDGVTTNYMIEILTATRVTNDKVKISSLIVKRSGPEWSSPIFEEGDRWLSVISRVGDDRYRVMFSGVVDESKILIKDGFVYDKELKNTNRPSPLLEKCIK